MQIALSTVAAPAPPMVSLVKSFLRAKQTDRAISFLQTILKTEPENAEAYVLLGSIQLANNSPDQAIGNFKAAIQKQPKNVIGYWALADFYVNQRNNDEALNILRAGLRELPSNVILHIALAGIFERTEDYEAAISEYEYVLSQQAKSLVAANNLASLLLDHRTDAASLERAQTLVARLPKSQVPQFKDTLGWAAYRRGDFQAAAALLKEAAAALPDVALIHYHLGMNYIAIGQGAMASKEFELALTKAPSRDLTEAIRGAGLGK
jgi:tetratricopeptide (TPR) repeat protein